MYILIFKIGTEHVLACNEDGTICSYDTPEAILENFKDYINKFRPGNSYESYASAGIGMMNTCPVGVLFNEQASFLEDFVKHHIIKTYRGSGFSKIMGISIDPLILEVGENIDIWKECMIAAGIYDPLKSDFQDPFKFSL